MFAHSKIHAALFSAALCLCNSAAADSLQFQSAREMQHELVILVDFPDSQMQFSTETFRNALNAEKYDGECSTGSVADYFNNSSHDAYRPVFDVFGIYTLPENNTQIFTSKYKTYLPTEDELKRELRLDSFHKLDE